MTRIWITRTQPQAEATAACVEAMGLTPVVSPVLETRPLPSVVLDLDNVDALAFTSAAAVTAFAALTRRRDLAVLTVGEATAQAARAAGFDDVTSADGDVAALAALIAAAAPRPAHLLNPTAKEPAADLPALLAASGMGARAVAVYETKASDLAAAPPDIDAILIHSAKGAARVAALITDDQARALDLHAISQAAAAPLAERPFRRVVIAAKPDEAALLTTLIPPPQGEGDHPKGGGGGLAVPRPPPERPPQSASPAAPPAGERFSREDDDNPFRPPSQGFGAAFWALIVFGFVCALAGLAVARLGPRLFPASHPAPPAAASAPQRLATAPGPAK